MRATDVQIGAIYAIFDRDYGWADTHEEKRYQIENATSARITEAVPGGFNVRRVNPATLMPLTQDVYFVPSRHILMPVSKRNAMVAQWNTTDALKTTTWIENGQSWSNVMPRLVAAGLTDQDDSERLTNVLAGLDLKGNERVNTDVTPDQIHKTTGHYVNNEGWGEETRTFTLTRDQATLLADALLLVAKHGGAK